MRPRVARQWRVVQLIRDADNTDRDAEDAPVRLLLFFDGDDARLPVRERMLMEMAQLVSGSKMPYATLMYIWENRQPVGTPIDSAHTGRVKMIVAGSGVDRFGQCKRFERNYVDDFRRAPRAPARCSTSGYIRSIRPSPASGAPPRAPTMRSYQPRSDARAALKPSTSGPRS